MILSARLTPRNKLAADRRGERAFVRVLIGLLLVVASATALHETLVTRDSDAALLLVGGSGAVLAHVAASLSLHRAKRRSQRMLSIGTSLAALAAAVAPAWDAIHPGTPIVKGHLGALSDAILVPPQTRSQMRILVSADLPKGKNIYATYALRGFRAPVEGTLERGVRNITNRRRLNVHRSSMFHRADLPVGPATISLQAWNGVPESGFTVELFAERIPVWLNLVLASLVVLGAAMLDRRLGLRGSMAAQAGAASVLGIISANSVTPLTAFAPAVSALVAAWCVGSLLGFAAARLMPNSVAGST